MLKVGMLFLCLYSFPTTASEFSHLKLKPQFKELITRPKAMVRKHFSLSAKSSVVDSSTSEDVVAKKFRSAVFGESLNPFPTDGEESLLYTEIRNHLEAAHENIGRLQVDQINLINREFNLGVQNFSGFSWQKPFGAIQIYADRQVTPNLFGENWLIQDTFVFAIDATSFLEKLSQSGLLDMSGIEIGTFAGITFKRVYTYYHYANSYQDGLSADFSKLFLPFKRFNQQGLERMEHEEIMKREDFWSARAGGFITTPPYYGVSLSGGVLAELAYQQTTTAQSTHTQQPTEQRYRLGINGKKSAQAGATLSLQLDFFKLIKFSLLNYDLNYEYAKATEFNLAFNQEQWEQVKKDAEQGPEMRKILRGLGQIKTLEPYIVRLDESGYSSLQTRGSVLVFGKLKKNKTEQVRVINDGKVKVFYKNYAQSIRVVQNLLGRIFSTVVYKVLKFPVGTSNAAMYSRQVTMEYEATHPQAGNPQISRIESSNQFSFVLTQSYEAARTDRWVDARFKKDVIWFVDEFTTLPKDYKTIIRSEQLKGPLKVESYLRVEKAGFDHLLNSNENEVWKKMAMVCHSKKISAWINLASRTALLKKRLLGQEACVKSLGLKFMHFKTDYSKNSLMPSLAKFKSFLTNYYKRSQKIDDLRELFGRENTFINGRLQATTSQGDSFVTSFSSGQFRGMGVIDEFKRNTGSRMPASIASE
jgi:hypothetical protein